MKTLIVEDDLMSQCLLAQVLTERGHEVVTFENAEQAILEYQKQSFPLLFVDVGLPGMTGLQFCKWVRSQSQGGRSFIMVATSPGEPDDLGEVLAAGANDFLVKPYDVGALNVRLSIADGQMKEFFERKQLEDSLRESHEDFDRLIRSAREGVWMLDARFQADYVNPQMAEMLGYQVEELIHRAVIDFVAESARHELEQLFAEQRAGQPVMRELRFRRKDATECPAFLSATPIRTADGEFEGSLWMVGDLTQCRTLESELADTRKEFEKQVGTLTGELSQTAQSLQAETAKREEAEKTLENTRADLARKTEELSAETSLRGQFEGQVAKQTEELRTQTAEYKRAELELAKVREELATRLKEHGAELARLEQALKAENATRLQAEEDLLQTREETAYRAKEHMEAMLKAGDELKAMLAGAKKAEEAFNREREEAALKLDEQARELAGVREQCTTGAAERQKLERAWSTARGELEAQLSERNAERARLDEQLKQRAEQLARSCDEFKAASAARARAETRAAAFAKLGHALGAARTPHEAARICAGAAQELLRWDAFSCDLYSSEEDRIHPILNIETVNGRPADVPPVYAGPEPSPIMRRVLKDGPQLNLRSGSSSSHTDFILFGDRARLSASLMDVAIRAGDKVVGFAAAQSYTPDAYGPEDLKTLQALADHCGGALQRIRAQEAQRQVEQRFLLVARATNEIVWDWNLESNQMWWNEAFLTLFGYKTEEIEPGIESRNERIHPEEKQRVINGAEAIVRSGGEYWSDEYRFRRQDGSYAQVLDRGYVVRDENGKPVRMIGAMTDLSQRPQVDAARNGSAGPRSIPEAAPDAIVPIPAREAQLWQAQKMESMGQFAAGVAHDFNNLLSVVQGYSTLIMEDRELKPDTAEALKEISSATERATHLTRQLLTFSRKQVIQMHPVDLHEVINHASKALRHAIGESIALQFNYSSGLPPVEADPGMMEQVILNLATNAKEAMSEGGQLTIATKVVEVDDTRLRNNPEARLGRFVCLSVTDTGRGMDEATLARIFEPFFKAKSSGKGTALGLATVYGIIKQHQGWTEAQSQVGQGTTFKIYLPISSKTPAPTTLEEDRPAVRGGTETILLVEDEPAVLLMAKGMLQRLGYQVITAPSGDEAVPIWREQSEQINLLLTDMVMPGSLNGRELAEKLLQEKPGLKVLYTSGYSVDLLGTGLTTRKDFIFLPKPYHPDTLARKVRDCLEGKAD